MMTFKKQADYDAASAENFEHPVGVSMTVPDMTLSIRELIEKHTVQNLVGVSIREPVYNGEDFIPDPLRMDLSEKEAFAEHMAQSREELQVELEKQQNERKQKDEEKKKSSRKQLLDELKQQQKDDKPDTP